MHLRHAAMGGQGGFGNLQHAGEIADMEHVILRHLHGHEVFGPMRDDLAAKGDGAFRLAIHPGSNLRMPELLALGRARQMRLGAFQPWPRLRDGLTRLKEHLQRRRFRLRQQHE